MNLTHRLKEAQMLVGYKIMNTDGRKVISGADSRQSFNLKKNAEIRMKGDGIYVGTSKQYVLDYYSGLADREVLLTFHFKKEDITSGNIEDREPELSLRSAKLIDWEFLEMDETLTSKLIEAVAGKSGIVYHRTKEDIVPKIERTGFKAFKGLYGTAAYTTYEFVSQQNDVMSGRYGDYIIASKINLDKFIILDIEVFKKVHPRIRVDEDHLDDFFEYVKKMNPRAFDSKFAQAYFNALFYNKGKLTSDPALFLYRSYIKAIMKYDGLLFTGRTDGRVAVVYTPQVLFPFKATHAPDTSFSKSDPRQFEWVDIKNKKTLQTYLTANTNRSVLDGSLQKQKDDMWEKLTRSVRFDMQDGITKDHILESADIAWFIQGILDETVSVRSAEVRVVRNWIDSLSLVWESGVWQKGEFKGHIWEGGIWESGVWQGAQWQDGLWKKGRWEKGIWEKGSWYGGQWLDGVWRYGEWHDGVWWNGQWNDGRWGKGEWKNGIWKDGQWVKGFWEIGVWKKGIWWGGVWTDGIWLDGTWYGGTWKNGEWQAGDWYNGTWLGGRDIMEEPHGEGDSPDKWK